METSNLSLHRTVHVLEALIEERCQDADEGTTTAVALFDDLILQLRSWWFEVSVNRINSITDPEWEEATRLLKNIESRVIHWLECTDHRTIFDAEFETASADIAQLVQSACGTEHVSTAPSISNPASLSGEDDFNQRFAEEASLSLEADLKHAFDSGDKSTLDFIRSLQTASGLLEDQSPSSASMQQQMPEEDAKSLWCTITERDDDVYLEEFERFSNLVAASSEHDRTYPKLVSFVGETRSGKSTLIKMLINRAIVNHPSAAKDVRFMSPVVGSPGNHLPTTRDLHLYADPATYAGTQPVLYADSEGLFAGYAQPNNEYSHVEDAHHCSRRLAWADYPSQRARPHLVSHLFPRILHTFSTVMIFVHEDKRTLSWKLFRMLDCVIRAQQTTRNQPLLPHAIMVLNFDDTEYNSPEAMTDRLLNETENSYIEYLEKLLPEWTRDRQDNMTVKDVISGFFSSFTVLQVPYEPSMSTLLETRLQMLEDVIHARCAQFHQATRALFDTETVHDLLQKGFDHFAKHLHDLPFDFTKAIGSPKAPLVNFDAHILNLATAFSERDAPDLVFPMISKNLASCILLDCTRSRKGPLDFLFATHVEYLKKAYNTFHDDVIPCFYRSSKGQECVLSRLQHSAKGHQDAAGRIIGPGEFQSKKLHDVEEWVENVRVSFKSFEIEWRSGSQVELRDAPGQRLLQLHQAELSELFTGSSWTAHTINHRTCFCCLHRPPEHVSTCGHALCSSCLVLYGHLTAEGSWELSRCPLHHHDTLRQAFRVRLKPQHAGVRVLSLDGGGVRGVVTLEVLRAIEEAIGCGLPIQAFFDLIIGTSTGGIIALALGVKQWSLEKCASRFVELCARAFTPRSKTSMPLMEQLTTLSTGSKYRNKPLRDALQQHFGDEPLFGSTQLHTEHPINVAVVATSGTGRTAHLISNYGRSQPESNDLGYEFVRPRSPDKELKIHEAAAATLAAPGFFKPFYHGQSGQTYLDGAIFYNNPVRVAETERKLLWPDMATSQPDILLSIGTGKKEYINQVTTISSEQHNPTHEERETSKTRRLFSRSLKTLVRRFDNLFDTERVWSDFRNTIAQSVESSENNYVRLSPDIGANLPRFDEKTELTTLMRKVREELRRDSERHSIQVIAFQLVASTFYLDRPISAWEEEQNTKKIGKLRCRFPNGSSSLEGLGRFLRRGVSGSFRPYFLVEDRSQQELMRRLPITETILQSMIREAVFPAPLIDKALLNIPGSAKIAIVFTDREESTDGRPMDLFPISGCSRNSVLRDGIADNPRDTISPQSSPTSDLRDPPASTPTTQQNAQGSPLIPSFSRTASELSISRFSLDSRAVPSLTDTTRTSPSTSIFSVPETGLMDLSDFSDFELDYGPDVTDEEEDYIDDEVLQGGNRYPGEQMLSPQIEGKGKERSFQPRSTGRDETTENR